MKNFLIKIFLGCLCLGAGTKLFAQDSTNATQKKITTTLAFIICNNADYYGQVAEEKMPYAALNANIRFKKGIYFSALAYKLLHDSAAISAGALTFGYDFNITKKLSADVSYSHAFYPASSPFLQAASPNLISAELHYEHLFKTGIIADYTFGKEQDFFVTLSNSKSFDMPASKEKAVVSITPQVDVTAGTQHFYQTYLIEKQNKGKGKNQKTPTTTVTNSYNRFGLVSYNFILPVSYSRAHYMLEAAAQLSLLDKNIQAGGGTVHSFFKFSAYYQL